MHRFIVYQYGKVGSTSLMNALNTMPDTQAFQSHFLGKDAFTQTLTRLQDLGVKPFLVSAAVHAIIAQRLVRRLCTECAEPYEPHPEELRALDLQVRALDLDLLRRQRSNRRGH